MNLTVRPLTVGDFAQVRPMLLNLSFVEDEVALKARFKAFCADPDRMPLGGVEARGARYLFCSAELQEGDRFFEVDFSERTARQPHPERGS